MSINVTRPFLPPVEEYEEIVRNIWSARWLTNNGPVLKDFEGKLKSYLGVKRLHLTVNGHMALETIVDAYGLKGEVITTPYTFASTTHSIVRKGLTPVFCDIRKDDFTLDPEKIEELITDKTCAIEPVHVYGYPCHVEEIEQIAQKYGLKVIYDAAHAFGVQYKGKSLCDYGDSAILSFHATKLFHTIEGGAVISHSDEFSQKVEEYKNYGIIDEETIISAGGNAKMNEFQAAMGLVNLRYIDGLIDERKNICEHYYRLLSIIPGISFHRPDAEEIRYNYAYFPILIHEEQYGRNRNELFDELNKHDVHARKYFYPATSDFECYKEMHHVPVPIAQETSRNVMCLPLYNGLTYDEVEKICSIIADYYTK